MKTDKMNNQQHPIPKTYPLCLHAHCPKAETCLRQLAFRRHAELPVHLRLLNPSQCTAQECCPYYADSKPVRFAKGFAGFKDHMLPRQYEKFMYLLIGTFGRNKYFRFRRGEILLSPMEQQIVRDVLKRVGVGECLEFDGYVDDINW